MSNTISPDTLIAQMHAMMEQAQNKTKPVTHANNQNGFSNMLSEAVSAVNSNQTQAAKLADAFQKGEPDVQMSEVMLSLQKANISFQAMVEVRNRLVSAYQEIMNMQV